MSTTPQQFEYLLASTLTADELITGKLDGTIIDYRTDIHGTWVKRPAKFPMIHSTPVPIPPQGIRSDELIEADTDDDSTAAGLARFRELFAARGSEPDEELQAELDAADIEAEREMEAYAQDAIERIRAWGWGESPTSFEGGFDED